MFFRLDLKASGQVAERLENLKIFGSITCQCGGVSEEVGEPSECVVVSFEVEAYPEPKILHQNEFKELCELYGSQGKAAKAVSCSRSFVTILVNRTNSKDR